MSNQEPRPLIWERPEPDERRATTSLTRAQIVAAAVQLGDDQGLSAVSIRNVAAALGVRPMRLYNHVSGKGDLTELMVDAIYGLILEQAGLPEGTHTWSRRNGGAPDWQRTLGHLAGVTRDTVLRHPWAIDLLGGRPHLGPHALIVGEATAAALSRAPGCQDVDALKAALGVLNSFLLGALRREIGELRAGDASGLDTIEWQKALGPYLSRQLATGRLPTINTLVQAPDPEPRAAFEAQLSLVLEGFTQHGQIDLTGR